MPIAARYRINPLLFSITLLLFPVARMGAIYLVAAVGLGGWFVAKAVRLWRRTSPAMALGVFKFSITYLGLLFAAVHGPGNSLVLTTKSSRRT